MRNALRFPRTRFSSSRASPRRNEACCWVLSSRVPGAEHQALVEARLSLGSARSTGMEPSPKSATPSASSENR